MNKLLNIIVVIGFFALTLSCDDEDVGSNKVSNYRININHEDQIPEEDDIKIKLEVSKEDQTEVYEGKFKRRGGYSFSFPKYSFEVDLKGDVSIAGLPADDDYILNANYIDKTFLRHVLSYEIFSAMNPNNIAPKSRYVELDLNNLYNGLYVLMERLDRSSLQINKEDDQALIFKEPHIFRESYNGIVPQNEDNFHQQKYPEIEENDKTDFIEEVREFILNSEDQIFTSDFSRHFDLQSIVDWHLLLLISNNSDGILKNFYIYKVGENSALRIAPWDYDHSFGRDGDNELNLDTRPADLTRSILFRRLLIQGWYKESLKNRWDELNQNNLLSVGGLKERVLLLKAKVESRVGRNFELWPINAPEYYDDNNFEEEIDIMNEFIDIRHARLVNYFSNL